MRTAKILLLIDDPAFRGRLLPPLRALGLTTILTGDGDHARRLISTEGPSLIVVDARIPGATGIEWVRARRENGIAVPMILCAGSKEEMKEWAAVAGPLGLESVVNRGVNAETFAKHIADVLPPPSAPSLEDVLDVVPDAGGDAAAEIGAAVETLRVSLVRLQQNAERRERIQGAIASAEALAEKAAAVGADAVVAPARAISTILDEALAGRRRMDGASFTEVERLMVRARDAAPKVTAAAATLAAARTRGSASAHEKDELSLSGLMPKVNREQDELTGLPSATTFLHEVNEMIGAAMIDGRPISVCVMVIVNAAALQAQGQLDRALAGTGRFLAGRFRPADRRGRWGDAAFAVAIPGTPSKMAADVIARTIDAFAQHRISDEKGARIVVTLAAGVVAYPKDAGDPNGLLALAQQFAGKAASRGGGVHGGMV
ncbi:MAG TPA: response regulator [bacterium]|nr:response regulator [bacterium]